MDVWRVLLFIAAVFLAIRAVVTSANAHRLRTLQKLRNAFEASQRNLTMAKPDSVSGEISNSARVANVAAVQKNSSVRLAADSAKSTSSAETTPSAAPAVRRAA